MLGKVFLAGAALGAFFGGRKLLRNRSTSDHYAVKGASGAPVDRRLAANGSRLEKAKSRARDFMAGASGQSSARAR